jgi:hypothetical protein
MGCVSIPALAIYASAASAAVGAYGAASAASAKAQADAYNAKVAKANQQIALNNADSAAQSGEAQAGAEGEKSRANAGTIKANEAASGVDINSGSAVDVQASQASLGKLDALTIRTNAAKAAYGYQVQASGEGDTAQLDTSAASDAATAGEIGAGSSILGGVSSDANAYIKYQQSGAFNAPLASGPS